MGRKTRDNPTRTPSCKKKKNNQKPNSAAQNHLISITMSGDPLQAFGRAKVEAVRLFSELSKLVEQVQVYFKTPVMYDEGDALNVTHASDSAGTLAQQESGRALKEKGELIRDAVSRNYMKVVFVGRTSNGKSTTINAMLHDRVLPTGSGHTTNCFCLVRGTERDQPFLLAPGSTTERSIADVKQLAHALSDSGRLESDALVDLYWPLRNCHLLENDVVLIDSPGLDIQEELDSFIDKHCTDADVFVLVSNFESSLSQTELKFFRRVATKISKPNIFVLFNRWDLVDEEENLSASVHQQHMQSARGFLVDELKLHSPATLQSRVFAVSSREALQRRTGTLKHAGADKDDRYRSIDLPLCCVLVAACL
jgi:GTPase SAR1 family protein